MSEQEILQSIRDVVKQFNAPGIKKKTGIQTIKIPAKATLAETVEIVGDAVGEIENLDQVPEELVQEYDEVCLQVAEWQEDNEDAVETPPEGDEEAPLPDTPPEEVDEDPLPDPPAEDENDGTEGDIPKTRIGKKGAPPAEPATTDPLPDVPATKAPVAEVVTERITTPEAVTERIWSPPIAPSGKGLQIWLTPERIEQMSPETAKALLLALAS